VIAPAQVRERDLGRCAKCGCGQGLHAHHRIRRSQGGPATYSNMITLCVTCHGWVHANPAQAAAGGWLISLGTDPCLVAVRHHAWPAGPIWLRDDGTVSLLMPEAPDDQ